MDKDSAVLQAAERLRAEGVPVTLESIRRELGGGSFRDISGPLARWKVDTSYQPHIAAAGLTPRAEKLLVAFCKQAWEEALDENRARFATERSRLEAEIATLKELLAQAASRADAMELVAARLSDTLDRAWAMLDHRPPDADGGDAGGDEAPDDAPDNAEKAAVWEEIVEFARTRILAKQGPVGTSELVVSLDAGLKSKAAAAGVSVTAKWIGTKLRRRGGKRPTFVQVAPGRFDLAERIGFATDGPGGDEVGGDGRP